MDCKFTNHIAGLLVMNSWVFHMAKYGYFLAIPIKPAEMNKIFKGCRVDEERIEALIDYIVPIVRDMWKRTKQLPVIQTELSQRVSKSKLK